MLILNLFIIMSKKLAVHIATNLVHWRDDIFFVSGRQTTITFIIVNLFYQFNLLGMNFIKLRRHLLYERLILIGHKVLHGLLLTFGKTDGGDAHWVFNWYSTISPYSFGHFKYSIFSFGVNF